MNRMGRVRQGESIQSASVREASERSIGSARDLRQPRALQRSARQFHALRPLPAPMSLGLLAAAAFLLAGCRHKQQTAYAPPPPNPYATRARTRATPPRPAPTLHGTPVPAEAEPPEDASRYGKPISTEVGLASWYGPPYANRKGANGQVYNQNAMTAAHRTLPFGTVVRVTNLATNQSAVVRITDRGPFVHGRVLDLSLAAAKATGVYRAGVAKVRIDVLSEQRVASSADHWCVQVGAFTKARDAEKLKNDLLRKYQTAKVIEFPGPTGHWVRINPAQPDKRHADAIAQSIRPKERDAEAYVVRLN
ncbi:MAG: septal ring lytic transglycosylase RlpA family protein [Acidobacteriaceae bacterium]